ncbi:MAG: tRNA pseudouridine(13) synthase TruD [Candidatus Odinarchaeota archaeon]
MYERIMGMNFYATSCEGLKGRIRRTPGEFIVEEIDKNGFKWCVDGETFRLGEKERFIHFTLVKEGYDTPAALRVISKRTGIRLKFLSYAGLKDKFAKTAQRISVPGGFLDKLKNFKHEMIKIKDLTYNKQNIMIGDLGGNGFKIKLVFADDEENMRDKLLLIREEIFKLGGVPNFYGHQRFGTIRCVNHQIGKLILRRRFEDAVKLFLTFKGVRESESGKNFRENILSQLEEGVDSRAPGFLFYESAMLKYLKKKPGDYKGCFLTLSKNISRLFVHSYQSYLFNLTLSERWGKNIPLNEAVKGDIILESVNGFPKYRRVMSGELGDVNSKVKSGKYRVVLPVIGYDSKLPDGETGECVLKILNNEKIKFEDFYIEEAPSLSSPGDYRMILSPVYNFEIEYDEGERAAWLCFDLEKGCYATVVVREFLKKSAFYEVGY